MKLNLIIHMRFISEGCMGERCGVFGGPRGVFFCVRAKRLIGLAHDTHHDAAIVELSNGLLHVADTGATAARTSRCGDGTLL